MLFRALAIWCGLLIAAFFNGALREIWLMPVFGDPVAHLVSAAILSAIVVVVAWAAIVWLHPHSANEALLIGDERVLLTIACVRVPGRLLPVRHTLADAHRAIRRVAGTAVGTGARHDARRAGRCGVRPSPRPAGPHDFLRAKSALQAIISAATIRLRPRVQVRTPPEGFAR